jgi:hypothetical protein
MSQAQPKGNSMQRMLVPAARGVIRHAPMAVRLLSMLTPFDDAAFTIRKDPRVLEKGRAYVALR